MNRNCYHRLVKDNEGKDRGYPLAAAPRPCLKTGMAPSYGQLTGRAVAGPRARAMRRDVLRPVTHPWYAPWARTSYSCTCAHRARSDMFARTSPPHKDDVDTSIKSIQQLCAVPSLPPLLAYTLCEYIINFFMSPAPRRPPPLPCTGRDSLV